jgi:tetratricopeptide (TPR) repeat protein
MSGRDASAPDETPIVAIEPFSVSGQDEAADFVARAFADSVAVNLTHVGGVEVLTDTSTAGGNHRLSGRIERLEAQIRLAAELRDSRTDEVVWTADLDSEGGDLSQAANCLARRVAEALDVEFPSDYVYIGNIPCAVADADVPLTRTAIAAWRSNDLETHLADSAQLVEHQPDSLMANALHASALAQVWDGTPTAQTMDQLRNRLAELDRIDADNPYSDALLAYVYRSSGEPGRAQIVYDRLLGRDDLSPTTRAWVLRQRSYASGQTSDSSGALEDARQAVRFDPSSASSYFAFSRSLESLGRFDDAIDASENALALEPLGWRYHQRLGLVLARLERFDEATSRMKRGCRLSNRQDACANLAVTEQRAGHEQEAASAAEQAHRLGESSWGQYNLACYWSLAGNHKRAIDSLQRALALGFADSLISSDSDLDNLRGTPEFEAIVAEAARRYEERKELTRTAFPWQ